MEAKELAVCEQKIKCSTLVQVKQNYVKSVQLIAPSNSLIQLSLWQECKMKSLDWHGERTNLFYIVANTWEFFKKSAFFMGKPKT